MEADTRPDAPAPTPVWAVRIDVSPEDFEGVLTLEAEDLVFTREDVVLRIGLGTITKMKRLRGSPVLSIETDGESGKAHRYAFFFAKPPPLKPPPGVRKRKNIRKSVLYLQNQGKSSKEMIEEWLKALRSAGVG